MDTERLNFAAGFAIDCISDVRIRRQDADDNPPMVVAVSFSCPDESREEIVQAYADEILERARAKGMNIGHPNFILLGVTMELCGGQITYRTADDIPLVDVPCPCGDPNHWLVKWSPWPAEIQED